MLSFIVVVLILFLIPGPAVLLTISQTARGGRKAGIITGVGIAVGDLIHTAAAVLGLSALLMTSVLAFEIVKYLGAIYLIYLGIKSLLQKTKKQVKTAMKTHSAATSFRQALLIELLNPKTALFFLSFLPQFIRHNGTPVVFQLLILGLTFVTMSIIYTSSLAIITSSIGSKLMTNRNGRFGRWQDRIVGSIYIGLGLRLVLQNQN